MAEFNLFLGTAKRSIGDITLMRKGGRQVARVRLRTISNPRSEAQSIQRNYVAPVTRFFGLLRKELRCSFEGLSKDASYNKFQRVNINLAKANGWYLPKGAPFTPMPYQLSSGRLSPVVYEFDTYDGEPGIKSSFFRAEESDVTIGDVSQQVIGAGYKAGDVVSFILVSRAPDGAYVPYSTQFIVNPTDNRQLEGIFSEGWTWDNTYYGLFLLNLNYPCVAGAIIISRYDERRWLRSTQFLAVDPTLVQQLQSIDQRAAAIESYQAGGSDDSGGVYPGGSDEIFNVAADDGRALLFIGGQVSGVHSLGGSSHLIMVRPNNLDTYFYIHKSATSYIATNAADSLNPADWRFVNVTPGDANESNSITWVSGNALDLWMRSVGYT